MQQITIPRPIYDAMVAHAREGFPNEICGVVLGPPGEMRDLHRAHNAAADPLVTYDISPNELLRLYNLADKYGGEFVAIYHSHPPFADIYPSSTDIAKAYHPNAIYIILAIGQVPGNMRELLRDPAGRTAGIQQLGDPNHLQPRLRAFRIVKNDEMASTGQVEEVKFTVK